MSEMRRGAFWDEQPYRVKRVEESGKVWYEVHGGFSLVVTSGWSGAPQKFRSLKSAQKCADKENRRQHEKLSRREEWV